MPSSVVFAALVLAWLVVLVPVVARRRGMVPRPAEADLSARVLSRGAAGPTMTEFAVEEVPVANAAQGRRHSAAMSGPSRGATAVAERGSAQWTGDGAERGSTQWTGDGAERSSTRYDDEDLDRELDLDAHDGEDVDGAGDHTAAHPGPSRERVLERGNAAYIDADADDLDDLDDDLDDDRARSYRPGRGGFDPEAAEVAAHARYAFRQRVALGLIAVAVLSALAALVVTSALWSLHVVTDLVLVGYLVFLRRQTRIEDEVRVRRAARMSGERRALEARRERQAAHDDLMAAHQWDDDAPDGWDATAGDLAEDEDAFDDADEFEEPAPRWAAPRTPAPPVPDGMVLVDDTDADPAFHELDDRDRVPAYRRAAAGA